LATLEVKCPTCSTHFECSHLVFHKCQWTTEYQVRVNGKLDPPGNGTYTKELERASGQKSTRCSLTDMNYRQLQFQIDSLQIMALMSTDPDYADPSKDCERKFSSLVLSFLESETRKNDNVPVIVLADAKTGADFMLKGDGRQLFHWVKQLVVSAGRKPQVVGYTFGNGTHGVERAFSSLKESGAIVVSLGGNTFELNEALLQVPRFRKLLIERVKSGQVFYTSYSAGSIVAGSDVSHARDHQPKRWSRGGLGLIGEQINPHAETAGRRPGIKITDSQGLFMTGCRYAVSKGR